MGAPNEKKFNAAIKLMFVTRIGEDQDVEYLRRQIHHADAAHPWVMSDESGAPAASIHWMSQITMREGEWIDRLYEVEIRPPFLLTLAQAYAYDRYGDQLARTLADIIPLTFLRVDSSLDLGGVFNGGYRPSRNQTQ